MSNEMTKYNAACRALADAKAVDEAKEIRDRSEAMRAYARQAKNKQLEVDAAEIRIRAERRIGELMKAQKNTVGTAQGRRTDLGSIPTQVDSAPITLSEAGIDKGLADRARKYAAVPEDEFEDEIDEWRDRVSDENRRVTTRLERRGTESVPDHFADAGDMVDEPVSTDEVELRERAMHLLSQVKCLPATSLVKAAVSRLLFRVVEMLSTGEPEDDEPVVKDSLTTQKDQIDAIYNAYPRKVAPQAAKKAIGKALDNPDVTFAGLIEAVEEYARSREGKDNKFTPHPATWFNRGSWDDDRDEWWASDIPKDKQQFSGLRAYLEREGEVD